MPAPKAKPTKTSRTPARKGPSEIAPGIYVGGWKDAVAFEGTRFCVLDEAPADMPESTHLPIYDEGKDQAIVANLNRISDGIRTAHETGAPVLVYCGHGVRRSPLAAAWYLHRAERLPLDGAYDRIVAVRPQIERAREWIGHPQNLSSTE